MKLTDFFKNLILEEELKKTPIEVKMNKDSDPQLTEFLGVMRKLYNRLEDHERRTIINILDTNDAINLSFSRKNK